MKTILISISPHASGPFTFYKNLKGGLKDYGWNLIGLTLNNKSSLNGFLDIKADNQDDINQELNRIIIEHNIHVFMPISFIEFHAALPFISRTTKIIKRATVLRYESVLLNKDYVDFFLATCPRQNSDLIKLGISANRLKTIPNFTILYKARHNNQGEIKFGFIGRLSHPPKGVLFIPKIFSAIRKKHKNVKLKYIGGGQDMKALKMMHVVDQLKGRVEFTGLFQTEDLPRLASDIDIFLMPSKTEGFGIALIEAMSMGIVPIVTKIDGVTDWIVEDRVSGIVVERHQKDFVENADFLIENPEKRRSMALAARNRVAELFSAEIVSKQYAELLDKVLQLPKKETAGLTPERIPIQTLSTKKKKLKFVPDFVKDIYKIISVARQNF